jgi:hypothetical protein
MSKKIRLTESELIDLIKRVISEQVPWTNLLSSVSDASGGPSVEYYGNARATDDFDKLKSQCEEEFKDYEFVANSFNWCRYNSTDTYGWDGNYAANQVKKDVQTTSSEDLITPAIKTISNTKDFCQFVNSYYKFKGDLYNDIDKYVYTYNKWGKIREAIPSEFKTKANIPVCKKFKPGTVS